MAELGKVVLELDETAIERLGHLIDEKLEPLLARIESLEWHLDSTQEEHYRDFMNLEDDIHELRLSLGGGGK